MAFRKQVKSTNPPEHQGHRVARDHFLQKKNAGDHVLPSPLALTQNQTPPFTDRVASCVVSPSPLLPEQPPQIRPAFREASRVVPVATYLMAYVTSIDRHCGPFVDCEVAAVRSRAGGRNTAFGTSSGMAAWNSGPTWMCALTCGRSQRAVCRAIFYGHKQKGVGRIRAMSISTRTDSQYYDATSLRCTLGSLRSVLRSCGRKGWALSSVAGEPSCACPHGALV